MSKFNEANGRFNYFFGSSTENYQFFRIPKRLITDERYKGVSRDAKLLYGLLLDRAALSFKNGWIDDEGRVYIIYGISEIMEELCCTKKTAIKFLAELDTEQGIGLVEKVRRGLGEKSLLYVKDFTTDSVPPEDNKKNTHDDETESYENDSENGGAEMEPRNCNFYSSRNSAEVFEEQEDKNFVKNSPQTLENTKKCKNYTSRSAQLEPSGVKITPQRCKNYTSGGVKNTLQEAQKLHPYINNNKTNVKEPKKNHTNQSTRVRARGSEGMDGSCSFLDEYSLSSDPIVPDKIKFKYLTEEEFFDCEDGSPDNNEFPCDRGFDSQEDVKTLDNIENQADATTHNDIVDESPSPAAPDTSEDDVFDDQDGFTEQDDLKAKKDLMNSARYIVKTTRELLEYVKCRANVKNLVFDAVKSILRADLETCACDRINALEFIDRRSLQTVCGVIARNIETVKNPQKYAETVLLNTLGKNHADKSDDTADGEYGDYSDYVQHDPSEYVKHLPRCWRE